MLFNLPKDFVDICVKIQGDLKILKVNHNKVISYSGKAPCLCCGEPVVYDTEDDYDYNERYGNCGSTICMDCLSNFRCDFCNENYPTEKHYDIMINNV